MANTARAVCPWTDHSCAPRNCSVRAATKRFRPFNRDNGRPRDGTNFPAPKIAMLSREPDKSHRSLVIPTVSLGNRCDYGGRNEGLFQPPCYRSRPTVLSSELLPVSWFDVPDNRHRLIFMPTFASSSSLLFFSLQIGDYTSRAWNLGEA